MLGPSPSDRVEQPLARAELANSTSVGHVSRHPEPIAGVGDTQRPKAVADPRGTRTVRCDEQASGRGTHEANYHEDAKCSS